MASIRINPDGSVDCESVDVAADLIRRLREPDNASIAPPLIGHPANESDQPRRRILRQNQQSFSERFAEFWGSLPEECKSFCRILEQSDGTTIEASEIANTMQLPILKLSWVRRKLNALANDCDISSEDLMELTKVAGSDNKPKTAYLPTQKFIKAMKTVSE